MLRHSREIEILKSLHTAMLFLSVIACFAIHAYADGTVPVCSDGTCSVDAQQASLLLQTKQSRVKEEQELVEEQEFAADGPDDLPKTQADKDSTDTGDVIAGPDEHGYIAKAREDVARELATVLHLDDGKGAKLMQGLDPLPKEVPKPKLHLSQEEAANASHSDRTLLQTELGPPPNPREGCHSFGSWHDSDGPKYNCNWYATTNRACQKYGGGYRNQGRTAKQACCACGGGSKKQQYYAFSHRTLTTGDIDQALRDGVNAIEIDVTAWWDWCSHSGWKTTGCWWAQHDGQCNIAGGDLDCTGGTTAAGDRLDVMLQKVRDAGAGKIAAVMIDIKNPDFCDPSNSYYKPCSVAMLKELVVRILGTTVNVVYDVYGQFSGVGYKWLQKNYRPCHDSTDAELLTSGYRFPAHMAHTYTYGGSFSGDIWGWCKPLEKAYLRNAARLAAFWTTTTASQVVTGCGNAIILGHTLFHYSKGGSSFKSVVDKAKTVARERGFQWPTRATSWCDR